MHVPDGFLDVPTSIATGVVAASAVGLALRRSDTELRESGAPLAGLTAVFIFAVQMVNFPVGAGTSGHLMGGVLAAVLVGPWTAVLCLTVVLVVQALVFADGGLTALGTNITLIGVVTVLVGYAVTRVALHAMPRRPGSVVPASAVGALLSVPAAALVFVGLYTLGGAVEIPSGALLTAMLGWHLLIGVGEALITAAVVGAVVATRPDLVYAARRLVPALVLVDANGQAVPVSDLGSDGVRRSHGHAQGSAGSRGARGALTGLAVASLVVAGGVSILASASPDGLEFVGESLGFGSEARDSAVAASPLSDYALAGVGNAALATGLAGLVGVVVTAAAGFGVMRLVRRGRTDRA